MICTIRALGRLLVPLLIASIRLPADGRALLKPRGAESMSLFTRSISADVSIEGQFATTTLTLVFQNDCSGQTEADFIYTLPSGAVATYFAYWAGEEKVIARIVEKKRAAAIYRRITSWRRDPALIELVGKNVFRARISPVFPKADLRVELVIVQALPSDVNGILYTLPIHDPTQIDPLDSIDARIRVKADTQIEKVTNNYGLPVEPGPAGYSMALAGELYRPPKDLNVRIVRKPKPIQVSLYAAPSGGPDGFFALSLTPHHSITSPRVTISGVKTHQLAPASCPAVRSHHSITLCGRYRGSGEATVVLEGKSPLGRVRYSEKVYFGSRPVPNNLATKLWAAGRIEQLGAMNNTRGHVIELSKRFTLPSKFASWLAIPKAELAVYKRSEIQPKLDQIGRRLGELIEAGKETSAEAQSLRKQFDELCRQMDAEPKAELREYCRSEVDKLCTRLADLVAEGTDSGEEGAALRRELSERFALAGEDLRQKLNDRLRTQAHDAALDLAAENARPAPDQARIQALKERVERASSGAGINSAEVIESESSEFKSRTPYSIARRLAHLVIQGKGEDEEAELLRKELSEQPQALARHCLRREMSPVIGEDAVKLVRLALEGKENSSEARNLRDRIDGYCRHIGLTQREVLEDYTWYATRETASQIARAILDGKDKPELRRRLATLCELAGRDPRQQLRHAADAASYPVIEELHRQMHSPKKDPARIASLKRQLRRIEPLCSEPVSVSLHLLEQQWKENRLWDVAAQLADLTARGQSSGRAGQTLRRELAFLAKKLQKSPHSLLQDAAENKMCDLAYELVWEKRAPSSNRARIGDLTRQIERLERASKLRARKYLESAESSVFDYNLWAARQQLESEIEREKPNEPRLRRLRNEHGRLVRRYVSSGPEDRGAWWSQQAVGFDAGLDEVIDLKMQSAKIASQIAAAKSSGDTAKAGELEKRKQQIDADFNKRWQELSTRWGGDPLISVGAPADALQVVAIMPDGEVKTLIYNADSARWEARFDTPIYAPEGDYVITIIVVLKDGTRKQLSLHYRIDSTPPNGTGTGAIVDNSLFLELDADPDTARVAALLPWGNLVRMRKTADVGRFSAIVPVPAEFAAETLAVTFILTDSAHNRTAITLDVSR